MKSYIWNERIDKKRENNDDDAVSFKKEIER